MRLLIINYELDDDSNVLAWQASVVRELASYYKQVIVLTGYIGRFESPNNVIVHLIPRRPWGIPKILGSLWLVNFTVAGLIRKHKIDVCFIHMAIEWTYRLFPALKAANVPILLWYAHGTVSRRLRLAHACATKVVTSTPEGFRLPSDKKIVIGQGINTELFKIPSYSPHRNAILYVGRISPRKRVHLLIKIMLSLSDEVTPDLPIHLRIIGPVLSGQDKDYREMLQAEIEQSGLHEQVEILGDMPQQQIQAYYQSAFLHLNLSQTGSMDKTVMEALACGCPVLTSNEAFFDFFKKYPEFVLHSDELDDMIKKIIYIYKNQDSYKPEKLRAMIAGHHDIHVYARKIYELSTMLTNQVEETPHAKS